MTNELLEGLSARTGGSCEAAVVGPSGCGKTLFARGLAASVSADAAAEEEGDFRARCSVPLGAGVFAFTVAETPAKDERCACAVLVTSDGSFGPARGDCISAEESAAKELKGNGIPFILVVNSAAPGSPDCEALRASLQEKYGAAAYAMNCSAQIDCEPIWERLLLSFPVSGFEIEQPEWMCVLPAESKIISEILAKVREVAPNVCSMRDCPLLESAFAEGDVYCASSESDPASGRAHYTLAAKEGMFYSVLSEECGADIGDDLRLMAYVRSMKEAKRFYDKFKGALEAAEESGYGIVCPKEDDMSLQPPELVRRGARCGVKLKADAASYHIIRVDLHSEVSPVSGESARSEEMAKNIMDSYERDPVALWNTDMFGRTFKDMVRGGLDEKLGNMPEDARGKLRKAVTRIVNEGKGGVICILL